MLTVTPAAGHETSRSIRPGHVIGGHSSERSPGSQHGCVVNPASTRTGSKASGQPRWVVRPVRGFRSATMPLHHARRWP
jgi:hypothetical protein